MSDIWHWRAVYRDGSFADEYDENGQHHTFYEVDHSQIEWVILVPQAEGFAPHALRIWPGSLPVFFRRTVVAVSQTNDEEVERVVIHCLGHEPSESESGAYTFFFPDGSVLVSNNHQAI